MATSGSSDFSLNSREICTEALQMIGQTPLGEDPQAEDAEKALRHLNLCLKTWGTEPRLWITTEGTQALSAATASYVLSAARRVTSVRRRTANIDVPLRPMSRQEYYDFPSKSATGVPYQFYFDPQRATRTLYVIGVPDATIAAATGLYYTYERVIEDSDSLDNDPDVPQEWLEALTYSLAARLLVPFDIINSNPTRAAEVRDRASALYQQLTQDSEEETSMFLQPEYQP